MTRWCWREFAKDEHTRTRNNFVKKRQNGRNSMLKVRHIMGYNANRRGKYVFNEKMFNPHSEINSWYCSYPLPFHVSFLNHSFTLSFFQVTLVNVFLVLYFRLCHVFSIHFASCHWCIQYCYIKRQFLFWLKVMYVANCIYQVSRNVFIIVVSLRISDIHISPHR